MESERLRADVELVSELYAERHGIDRTDDWFVLKLNEEVGELTQAYLALSGQARDKGRAADQRDEDFRAELADVFAQVLLLAERFDIDLSAEVHRKWLVWKPPR
jgi:NTP pyrophosphatase (non-canonical NTP hydrolase)